MDNYINTILSMKSSFVFQFILILSICWSCSQNSNTEKHQSKRNNIIDVRDQVKEIQMEDVLIGSVARLFIDDEYLIIGDIKSQDKLIHIFDKNNFNYLASTAPKGSGPGEIANMGHIAVNESERVFYVSDHGNQKIFSYNFDSVLANPLYKPDTKYKMNKGQFPSNYHYINDTLSIGLVIEPTGNSGFNQSLASWNLRTGVFNVMKYKHPKIEKKRVTFAVSTEHNMYVECYIYHDLITICNLDGTLKYNVYGKDWDSRLTNRIHYFGNVFFCGDKILASFSGGDNFTNEYSPTKFIVFDLKGKYIKTLETGYRITDSCYDKENNRIILNLDDMMQFAYLNLDKLI